MNNLFFIIFNLILYFSGRTFLFLLSLSFPQKKIISNELIKSLYPIFTLFFIGNLTIFLNFFFPIKSFYLFIFILVILFSILGIFLDFKNILNRDYLVKLFLLPLILSSASYGIKFHYDSGLYHLNFQNWIFENKITFGLANLNPFYGYSWIQEYLSSLFFIFNINLFNFFIELIFVVTFFSFLYSSFNQSESNFLKNSTFFLTLFLFFDNFGIGGGGNGSIQIQMVGKPDVAIGILYIIVGLITFNDLKNFQASQFNFFIILALSLFAFQLKPTGAPLLFVVLYYFFKSNKNINLFHKENLLLIFLGFNYLLKNFIISGCLLFPISQSCLQNLPWINFNHLKTSLSWTIEGNFRTEIGSGFIKSIQQFLNHAYNFQIYSNFLISIFVIFLIRKFLFTLNKTDNNKLALIIFLIANYIYFFVTVPAFRNAFGLFLLVILIFTLDDLELKIKYKFLIKKSFFVILFLITTLLFPRMYMYNQLLQNKLSYLDFSVELVSYTQFNNDFVVAEFNKCWKNINCIIPTGYNNYFFLENKFGYKIIYSSSSSF